MKHKFHDQLFPFYFGTIGDDDRLRVERMLLEEPDTLVDYFDLKRNIEAVKPIPIGPSPHVWGRLSEKLRKPQRKTVVAISLGFALAASIAVCLLDLSRPKSQSSADTRGNGILFDPGHELSSGTGVL